MIARVHSSILQVGACGDSPGRGIDAVAGEVEAVDLIPVTFLTDAMGFLTEELPIDPFEVDLAEVFAVAGRYDVDFGDVRGQVGAQRRSALTELGQAEAQRKCRGYGR